MASASDQRVFSMHELKDALLACSVCMEADNDGQLLQLKLLNCHHTVCIGCLNQLIDGKPNFSCPKCRRVMAVPAEGVQGIQNNFIAEQIQDFANGCKMKTEVMTVEDVGRCGRCKEEIEIPEHQCVFCGHLCSTCKWNHHEDKSLHHHTIFTIPKATDHKKTDSEFCAKHNLCRINLFCKTCQVAICKMCKELIHKDHHHLVLCINEVAIDSMSEIESLLESVFGLQAHVFLMYRKVRQAEERVKTETHQMKTELETFFQECHTILSKREMELIGSIEHQSKQLHKFLLYSKEHAQDLHAKMGSSLEYAEQIKKLPPSLALIRAAKALKPALLDLANTHIDTDITHSDFTFLTAEMLQSDIARFKQLVSFIGKTDNN